MRARRKLGALAALFACFALPAQAECDPARIAVTTPTTRHEFSIELADTEATRAKGLMMRADMPLSAGMLFVYDAPQRAQFWMANTLIPLDMIFAGSDGVILQVHENAIPQDRSVIDGGAGVKYVLEINGGLAARMGIAPGGALHHPAITGSDCAAK
jgi:uncharacterized membrane protein (UPF0127 family)